MATGTRSSLYKEERQKYMRLFRKCRTHHLKPHERGGDDTEFNLFPWSGPSHEAWHILFGNLSAREAWPLLEDANDYVWGHNMREFNPQWRWEHRQLFKKEEQREFSRKRGINCWRAAWLNAFGGPTLEDARQLMRCMMATMVFGHHAYNDDFDNLGVMYRLLRDIPSRGDRVWAFETCFTRPVNTHALQTVRRQVRELVRRTTAARP